MDYIDKRIYQVCKVITREYSIVKNETMRHNREYPQVVDCEQINKYFVDVYPNLYCTMIEYHGSLMKFLLDEINGTYINNKLNLVLSYKTYQERLSLKLPLQTDLYNDDELLLLIIPKHRVISIRDNSNNKTNGEKQLIIDCRFGNLARNPFTEAENKRYYQRYKKLQNYYNMTKSKYDQHYSLERKRLKMSYSLYDNYKVYVDDDFNDKLLPSENTLQKQSILISRLNKMLEDIWPNKGYKIIPFGSSVSDLMLNESDIDISIVLPDDQRRIWEYANDAKHPQWGSVFNIDFIASQMELRGMKHVEAIHAIVPICKFKDPVTKINCDLSICNNLAIENSKLIATYLKLDDRIRPLLYLIKFFTKKRHINKSISGTLSSYAYVLLFLAYLMVVRPAAIIPNLQNLPVSCESPNCIYQKSKNENMKKFLYRGEIKKYDVSYHNCVEVKNEIRNILNNNADFSTSSSTRSTIKSKTIWESYNSTDLATLLIEFFELYSSMDFDRFAIAPSESGIIRRERENRKRKDSIVIKDPFIKSRNVATTCTEIGLETIQKEFQRAYNILTNGGTWKEVCSRPDLRKRPIDPHSVENKKGYKNNGTSDYINDLRNQIEAWPIFVPEPSDHLNSLKYELENALSTTNQQKLPNNYYQDSNNRKNNNNADYPNMEFNALEDLIPSTSTKKKKTLIKNNNNNNDDFEDDEDDDDYNGSKYFYKEFLEALGTAIANENVKEKEKEKHKYSNEGNDEEGDEDNIHYLVLKNVPEYVEEEHIISAFCIYGYIIEMERLDGKPSKKDKYYSYYNWNICLNAYDFLPLYFDIDGEAIFYDYQME